MIYLASSWRNPHYENVLHHLQDEGFTVYDFKEEGSAFNWNQVDPNWVSRDPNRIEYAPEKLTEMLNHPIATQGFRRDFQALYTADQTILLLPCNRSAHLELGYSIGRKIPTAVFFTEPTEPELMWRMASLLTDNFQELVAWLRATAPIGRVGWE